MPVRVAEIFATVEPLAVTLRLVVVGRQNRLHAPVHKELVGAQKSEAGVASAEAVDVDHGRAAIASD